MKFVLASACILMSIALAIGQGVPTRKCPKDEHSVLYCPQRAEPSCDNPTVHDKTDGIMACDIPQCFCNNPLVRDLKTNKCVKISDCSSN